MSAVARRGLSDECVPGGKSAHPPSPGLHASLPPCPILSCKVLTPPQHPLCLQGDYVLVFTSRGHARLPSMWIMGAYRSLPRPFRKNVQHVVLVRPSGALGVGGL